MDTERIKTISPVVDILFPQLSDEEKEKRTEALRPYFRALYESYCRMDRDGLLDPDSLEPHGDDRIGVANNTTV